MTRLVRYLPYAYNALGKTTDKFKVNLWYSEFEYSKRAGLVPCPIPFCYINSELTRSPP